MSCSTAVTDSKTNALIRLMDDPSDMVHKAILKELESMEVNAAKQLLNIAMGLEEAAQSAEALWEELFGPIPEKQFEHYIRDREYDLETAYILLSQIIDPSMNPYNVMMGIDDLADTLRERLDGDMNDWEKCRVLSSVLFDDMGFGLNDFDAGNPLNWSLNSLVNTRVGHPVALCVLYVLVGLRSGIDLEMIHMPGRFFVGCFSEGIPLYIDVTSGGEFRSQGELMNLLFTEHTMPHADFFSPMSVVEVLIQCCKDLALHYRLTDHPKQSKLFSNYLKVFARKSYD